MGIEVKIKQLIDSFTPEQNNMVKEILFFFANQELINKIKAIYEQPVPKRIVDTNPRKQK